MAIAAFYAEADRLTRETGIPYHVDHIVPLQSPIVCGLYAPANLRPIPGAENCSKGQRVPASLAWAVDKQREDRELPLKRGPT